jgi:hypothetical protein
LRIIQVQSGRVIRTGKQAMTTTTKTIEELTRMNAGLTDWIARSTMRGDVDTVKMLVSDREAVRAELDLRKDKSAVKAA